MVRKHPLSKSFKFAFEGLSTAFRNEPNMQIHAIFAVAALIFAVLVGLSRVEWLFLAFTIFWVISLELLNTVLEALVNIVSPEHQPYAKVAKDVSAACVLLAAFLSVIVGVALFVPKVLQIIP